MIKRIIEELREHAPFTLFGALTGILLIFLLQGLPHEAAHSIFYVLHPAHVLLSALVTASMYQLHTCRRRGEKCDLKCNLWLLLIIGYVGSIGIATLSDSLIPFLGETIVDMPHRHAHIGFIEAWWLVNPLAIIGIAIAYFRPSTKVPHYFHVLLSTWASIFHILMAKGHGVHWTLYLPIFLFLFIAVWLPCCISDIVFPLLFVRKKA